MHTYAAHDLKYTTCIRNLWLFGHTYTQHMMGHSALQEYSYSNTALYLIT